MPFQQGGEQVFRLQEGQDDFITNRYRVDIQYRGVNGSPPNAITFRALYGSASDLNVRYEPPTATTSSAWRAIGKTCSATAYFDGTCTRELIPHATPSGQATAQAAAVAKTIRAFFACDGGKTMSAVFTNGTQSSVKLNLSDGRELSVPQAVSGSGARYANSDESFVFWNQGNMAFIEENGKTTYSNCATKR